MALADEVVTVLTVRPNIWPQPLFERPSINLVDLFISLLPSNSLQFILLYSVWFLGLSLISITGIRRDLWALGRNHVRYHFS